jgi:hypothetical protein
MQPYVMLGSSMGIGTSGAARKPRVVRYLSDESTLRVVKELVKELVFFDVDPMGSLDWVEPQAPNA